MRRCFVFAATFLFHLKLKIAITCSNALNLRENTLYRSPNQWQDDFEWFMNNFQLNFDSALVNIHFLSFLVFLMRKQVWHNNDITTYEGSKIDGVTSQLGLEQKIKKSKYIIDDSSSCINLIFTTRPNLVTESGVHSSLPSSPHNVSEI